MKLLSIVAGNIRRSAGMRQSDSDDDLFANAKGNLWQDEHGGELTQSEML